MNSLTIRGGGTPSIQKERRQGTGLTVLSPWISERGGLRRKGGDSR